MTGWDHEFAVPFINEGLFHVLEQATVLMTTVTVSHWGAPNGVCKKACAEAASR